MLTEVHVDLPKERKYGAPSVMVGNVDSSVNQSSFPNVPPVRTRLCRVKTRQRSSLGYNAKWDSFASSVLNLSQAKEISGGEP